MWDLIASVPDHCLSFYFSSLFNEPKRRTVLLESIASRTDHYQNVGHVFISA